MEWFHKHLHPSLGPLYWMQALITLVNGLMGIFVPIFLYRLGYSLPHILFFFLLSGIYFLILTPLGVLAVSRWGCRGSLVVSIFFWMAYYAGLHFLESSSFLFWILPMTLALKSIFSNFAFHLYFLEHSHKTKRGKEVSRAYSAVELAGFIGPVVGGWLLGWNSWGLLLGLSVGILFLSVLPLCLVPEKKVAIDFSYRDLWKDLIHKKNRGCVASFTGYAIEYFLNFSMWPVFLATLAFSAIKIGFLVSLSLASSLIVLHLVGKGWDQGMKKKLLIGSSVTYALSWFARIFVNSGWSVWLVDSWKNWAGESLTVSWSAYNYDLAGKHFLRFVVFREVVFNLARLVFIPLVILLVYSKASFIWIWILGGLFSLLYPLMAKYQPAI